MEISIICPTFNNLNYLRLFIKSIKENSFFNHELIFHINDGSDGSLNFIRSEKIKYTHSNDNIGLCSAVNNAFTKSTKQYILYAHDDMYFCKNWDKFLEKEVNLYKDNLFYLSGTNVSYKDGLINYDCGNSHENFDIKKFNDFCINDKSKSLQGSHWAPHLIPRDLWIKIGGFSEEFNPGDGSDPDLCCKLWFHGNVRIFKCVSLFKVYHFGSVTIRKNKLKKNNGTKLFLLKWRFNPRFFRKYYLCGNKIKIFDGPLQEPKLSIVMIFDLIINKLKYFYYNLLK
jgi:glycosyltransferase involved in cell wall biosynthesis